MVMHHHKMRRLIQIFTPTLPMLNSRLTKIYKAPHFRHYSVVCLCTTEAPLIWSKSMKAADSPRHQTDVFDQTAACRADTVCLRDLFKHMSSCYAAPSIYLKHTAVVLELATTCERKRGGRCFCRDKQAPLTRNNCVI